MTSAPSARLDRPMGARRGVTAIVLGTVLGQGLLVAISPVLSRLYDHDDFALLQVFTGVVSMAAAVAGLRLELALPLARDDREVRAVLRTGLVGTVAISAGLWVLGLLTAPWWAHGRTLEQLRDVWWVVPLTVAAVAAFQLVSAVLVRAQRFGDLAWRNAAQGVGTAAGQIGFGLAAFGPIGLLLGTGLGRLVGLTAVVGRRRLLPPATEPVRLADMRAALSRFRRFPLVTSWSALLNNAAQWAPAFVFPLTYGAGPAGLLGFTMRLLTLPITVVGQAVAQVFLGKAAEARRENTGELPRLTWLAVRRLALVGAGPALLLGLVGPWAFELIFGARWERAGTYAQILAVAFFVQFVASPIGNVFNVTERQDVALCWDAVRLLLAIVVPTLVWALGGSDLAGVAAYGGVLVVSYAGVLLLAGWVLRRV
ncbi:MAG TPA: lipopolysaccharide biosynthesis protein [Actinopolymorphaceae bacterium]